MFIWFALLISIVTCAVLVIFWRRALHWAELIVPFATTFLFILVAKSCSVSNLTIDEEYWGGYVTSVEYYEDWDEWIDQTCSYEVCSGSGENQSCTTYYYDCSYRDYHAEYWLANTTLSFFSISEERYDKLVKQFGTGKKFLDMKRDFYKDDGDAYVTSWGGQKESLEPVAEMHTYENRPQASLNVFRYEIPDSADIKRFKLFTYPKVVDHKQKTLLGYNDSRAQQSLHYINSLFGAEKQVRIFLLVFQDLPREAGIAQENYWAGGNKNEFVVCVGKSGDKIRWAHTFSWTDEKRLGVNVRHEVEALSRFDAKAIVNITATNVLSLWKRKQFSDFDYLSVNPTPSQTLAIFVWAMLIQAAVGVFLVKNNFSS